MVPEIDLDDYDGGGFQTVLSLIGLALLAGGTILLFLGEAYFQRQNEIIGEAGAEMVELADISRLDTALDGRLVHASGMVEARGGARDPLFGVTADAVCLDREVSYYQWVKERVEDKERRVSYRYSQKWVDRPIDSNAFEVRGNQGYRNYILVPIYSEQHVAPDVTFGAYRLPDFLKREMPEATPAVLRLDEREVAAIQSLLMPGYSRSSPPLVHAGAGYVYLGRSEAQPAIGDMKIRFLARKAAPVTLIAAVAGDTFSKYRTGNGELFSRIYAGTVGAGDMLGRARLLSVLGAWGIRLAFFVLVFVVLKATPLHPLRDTRGVILPALTLAAASQAIAFLAIAPGAWRGYVAAAIAVAILGLSLTARKRIDGGVGGE